AQTQVWPAFRYFDPITSLLGGYAGKPAVVEFGQPFVARGFVHFSPENREKSRSVVQTMAPCSSAIAARAVSMTSGPAAWPSCTRPRRMSQCRSPGSRIPADGWAGQEGVAASAHEVQ